MAGQTLSIPAHRYAYLREHGFIPPGRMICHRCNHKPCVNTRHLYAGTSADNVADIWRDPISMARYLERALRSDWKPEAKTRVLAHAARLGITCADVAA